MADGLGCSEQARLSMRMYFRSGWEYDLRERGCLLLTDDTIVPFKNISPSAECMIEQGRDDFITMARLFRDDRIKAVAHSHPVFPPRPSSWDLKGHQYGFDMIIYSCIEDIFKRYTSQELQEIRRNENSTRRSRRNRIVDGDDAEPSDNGRTAGLGQRQTQI